MTACKAVVRQEYHRIWHSCYLKCFASVSTGVDFPRHGLYNNFIILSRLSDLKLNKPGQLAYATSEAGWTIFTAFGGRQYRCWPHK